MTKTSKRVFGKAGLAAAALSTVVATNTTFAANGSPDFTINGTQANFSNMEIFAGTDYKLRYNGGKSDCTDVKWHFAKPGFDEKQISSSKSANTGKQFRQGDYTLKVTTKGQGDKRWFFNLFGCKNTSGEQTRTVNLHMEQPGLTQTQHPIMFVPGVFGYDRIELLNWAYFFGIGDELKKYSDQDMVDVSLDPWQDTEDRGADLADKVVTYMIEENGGLFSGNKVNLIAHSHGATTTRMALNILATELNGQSHVASFTSVAGPHYGTPTADGTQWGVENWDEDSAGGAFIHGLMFVLGDMGTALLNLVTGDFPAVNDYAEPGIYDVVADFTQKGMLRFNACYPSAGIANVDSADSAYFIESNLPHRADKEVFTYDISKNGDNTQATISIDDCRIANAQTDSVFDYNHAPTVTKTINLAAKPDDSYGKDIPYATPNNSNGVFGNGLGDTVPANDPSAIRYFSFTGKSSEHWNTNWFDVGDAGMALFLATHQLAGAKTDESNFWEWIGPLVGNIAVNVISETPLSKEGIVTDAINVGDSGYRSTSDSFIPVDSTKFGEFINDYPAWNHMDEVNGFFGLQSVNGPDPLAVYRAHANRLQTAGM